MSATYGPFEASLGVVAGYHTGEGQFVGKDFVDRPAVHFHEGVHGRIFAETPDGIFHRFCLRTASQAPGSVEGQAAGRLAKILSDEMRTAHERAATYLGITTLDAAAGAAEVAALIPEYAEYYRFFSELLDSHIRSSYVRYAFAWAITTWAFGSSRVTRLAHEPWHDVAAVRSIEGPTGRMNRLAAVAQGSGFAESLRELMRRAVEAVAQQGIAWTDIDAEQEWMHSVGSGSVRSGRAGSDSGDSVKVRTTDAALVATMHTWLRETVAIEMLVWDDVNTPAIAARLATVQLTLRRGAGADGSTREAEELARQSDLEHITGTRRDAAFVLKPGQFRNAIKALRWTELYVTAVIAPGADNYPFLVYVSYKRGQRLYQLTSSPYRITYRHFCRIARSLQGRRGLLAPIALLHDISDKSAGEILSRLDREGTFRFQRAFGFEEWVPDRRVPVVPFLMQQRRWTAVLGQTPGKLMKLNIDLLNPSTSRHEEFVACCLFPRRGDFTPYLNISTILTDALRNDFELQLAAAGGLEVVHVTEAAALPIFYQLIFTAIWDHIGKAQPPG